MLFWTFLWLLAKTNKTKNQTSFDLLNIALTSDKRFVMEGYIENVYLTILFI